MKKIIFLVCILVSLTCCKESKEPETEFYLQKFDGNKGNIESTFEKYYTGKEAFGEYTKGRKLQSAVKIFYDEEGRRYQKITYFPDGSINDKVIEYYDDTLTYFVVRREQDNYDYGDLLKVRETNDIIEKDTDKIVYVSKTIYGISLEGGNDTVSVFYDFDKLTRTQIDKNNSLKYIFYYDKEGNVFRNERYTSLTDTLPTDYYLFSYDENNFQIENKMITVEDGKERQGKVNSMKYTKTDDEGNWTEAIIHVDGKALGHVTREISYRE